MGRRRLPEIAKSSLRDYDSSEQSAAVWRRLKSELRGYKPRERRSPLLWVWAPALAAVLFGSGVLVGARLIRPQALAFVQAEPRAQPVPAAGPVTTKNTAEPEVSLPEAKVQHPHARRSARLSASAAVPLSYGSLDSSPYAAPTQAPAPEWQRLVEIGDFPGARRALDRQGGFDVAMAHASPSELMSLVDIARASGERGLATSALRQVLAHAEAPEAPLAAWTLGNLLDQAGDQPGAAQAFALYRRLSPAGDFAEDAAARQVDVALAEGNLELVTQLASDYARDFPHGRRLSEFRRAERALRSQNGDRDAGPKTDTVHDEPDDDSDESHAPPSSVAAPNTPGSEAH
ncbi:MAG TPA: hypothetical protein VJV79_02615 [Polyangiaceae bacterium]|nr:hypothetical protein [Polyangiaceae bacterium]